MLLRHFGKGEDHLQFVEDRKGHDFRYSLDCSKIRKELGWKPKLNLEKGLKLSVDWYVKNEWWWKPLIVH